MSAISLARWIKLRPKSILVGGNDDVLFDTMMCSSGRQHISKGCFVSQPSELVNPKEQNRLQAYIDKYVGLARRKCSWEDLIVNLGDNPSTGWTTWSAVSCALPTLRRSAGLMYVPSILALLR